MSRLIASYEDDLAWNTPPPGISVRITGQSVLMTTVMTALTSGRVEMSLLGLVLIFILLLIIYRDLIKALLPVLPMLVVIGWMGLVMYYGGLKYTPLITTFTVFVVLAIRMEIQREVFENAKQDLKKAIALINHQSGRRINGN